MVCFVTLQRLSIHTKTTYDDNTQERKQSATMTRDDARRRRRVTSRDD